jgi:hypothetical protein
MKLMNWLFVCWFAFVGIMAIRGITQSLRKSAGLRQHGRQTQGVVVRNKVMWGRIIVIRPVVRFTTTSGQVIEAVDHMRPWTIAAGPALFPDL